MKHAKAVGLAMVAMAALPMLLGSTSAYGMGADLRILRDESASHVASPSEEIRAALSNAKAQACDGRLDSANRRVAAAATGMAEARQDASSARAAIVVAGAVLGIASIIAAKFG